MGDHQPTHQPAQPESSADRSASERKLIKKHRNASGDGDKIVATSQPIGERDDDDGMSDPTKVQVVIPLEEFEEGSTELRKVRWSLVDREEAVRLSEDRLTASCLVGYRALRCTHGVSQGCWFYELEIEDVSNLVTRFAILLPMLHW